MPSLAEDRLSLLLSEWIDENRPEDLPSELHILVASRDEIRTRPCVVLHTSEAKPVPAMPHTFRMKVDVHLFSQVDDTPAPTHALWAALLASALQDKPTLQADLDSDDFILHDLIERETTTAPDETRGRESILTYEAVVSAV
jgi:hypothetical protein